MRFSLWIGLALTGVALLNAQDDPPSRVARLNLISGNVSFQPGGTDDWVEAQLNRPLTTGDHLWVDNGGRAELHIGSTAIRLNGGTGFAFLNLDDRAIQIRLSTGSINIRVRRLDDDQSFEVDTPNLAFSLLRPGDYRVDAHEDGQVTMVRVRGGDGEATGGGQAFPVHARQEARISGLDSLTSEILDTPPPDVWDRWCLQRDRREEGSESAKFVSREVGGYEDLDEHGTWRPVAGYGNVWVPRGMVAGWAPYRYGHWAWVEPWGWTWVDDAPWGFAPFHYGRWAFIEGNWGWIPGPIAPRPVYSPALVAFVGGSHFNLSVSIGGGGGGVAWFPLGPGEVYRPAYHASPRYVTNVNTSNTVIINKTNITNVTTVTNVTYVNQTAPGAVTAVPRDAFVRSKPVAQAAVPVSQSQMASAQVSTSAQVAPMRESLAGGATASVRPSAAISNRAVVAKNPPPPRPVPFAARQQALQADPGRPLQPAALEGLRKNDVGARPLVRQATPMPTAGSPVSAPAPLVAPRAEPPVHATPPARVIQAAKPIPAEVHPDRPHPAVDRQANEERKAAHEAAVKQQQQMLQQKEKERQDREKEKKPQER